MSNDFQSTLKLLGKQAKQAEQVRAEEERQARLEAADTVDFAKEIGGVVPLKNSNRYALLRFTTFTPTCEPCTCGMCRKYAFLWCRVFRVINFLNHKHYCPE